MTDNGRPGICGQEQAITTSYKICPKTKKLLADFCLAHGFLSSQVVNWAIQEYIAKKTEKEKDMPD